MHEPISSAPMLSASPVSAPGYSANLCIEQMEGEEDVAPFASLYLILLVLGAPVSLKDFKPEPEAIASHCRRYDLADERATVSGVGMAVSNKLVGSPLCVCLAIGVLDVALLKREVDTTTAEIDCAGKWPNFDLLCRRKNPVCRVDWGTNIGSLLVRISSVFRN